jgi:uncharacterized protein YpuA (DUF1002 family)
VGVVVVVVVVFVVVVAVASASAVVFVDDVVVAAKTYPLTSSSTSGIASNILGMLEHTGVSLEHTRITPQTHQEATNDYTGIDLKANRGTGPRNGNRIR